MRNAHLRPGRALLRRGKAQSSDSNKRRGKFVWDLFHSRYNEPNNFDLVVNTDYFAASTTLAELNLDGRACAGIDQSGRRRNR